MLKKPASIGEVVDFIVSFSSNQQQRFVVFLYFEHKNRQMRRKRVEFFVEKFTNKNHILKIQSSHLRCFVKRNSIGYFFQLRKRVFSRSKKILKPFLAFMKIYRTMCGRSIVKLFVWRKSFILNIEFEGFYRLFTLEVGSIKKRKDIFSTQIVIKFFWFIFIEIHQILKTFQRKIRTSQFMSEFDIIGSFFEGFEVFDTGKIVLKRSGILVSEFYRSTYRNRSI